MDKDLLKNVVFYIGCIATFVTGLLYVLLADWVLTTQSLWLMLAIMLSIGSAVCLVLSARYKESPKVMYTLKGIALGLAVGLIVFFVVYLSIALAPAKDIDVSKLSAFQRSFAIKSVHDDITEKNKTIAIFAVIIALGAISIIAQALDLAFTATMKEE